MRSISYYKLVFKLKSREKINYVLGPFRHLLLKWRVGVNDRFTIISNNCWGGHVYRYFRIPYLSPTVGLYMFSEDYIKFVYNLKHYTSSPLSFISYYDSKYKDVLEQRGGDNVKCPIARIDDIEVVFLHYKSNEEALKKWTRRCSRIEWDNLFYKMSEQNLCDESILRRFDKLDAPNKILFVHKDYGLDSQVIFKDFATSQEVLNDTNDFRKYVNLIKWIRRDPEFKRKQ